jgi:uncharacterized membrane protein
LSADTPEPADSDPEPEDAPGAHLGEPDEVVEGEHVPDHAPGEQRVEITEATSFSGPLPPPGVLRGYDDVVPGLAREIVDQWKGETAHRHQVVNYLRETDRLAMEGYYAAEKRSQIFGLIAIVFVIALAALAVVLDRPIVGVAALLTGAGAAIWAMRRSSSGGDSPPPTDLGDGDEIEHVPDDGNGH